MSPVEKDAEIAVLTAVQAAYNANEATVEAGIAAIEGGVENLLVTGLKNLAAAKVGGIVGAVLPSIEGAITAELQAQAQVLIAKYGPSVVYAFGQHELTVALAAAQAA